MSTDLLLRDFQPHSTLVTEEHIPTRARFPLVDVNNHIGRFNYAKFELDWDWDWNVKDVAATVALMDELNVRCVVDLSGGWGEMLRLNLERYKQSYPDRFCVFAWCDWTKIDEPGFGEKWAKELERSVASGAQGLKVLKTLGLRYRDQSGRLFQVDDPRLDPIWAAAGELKIPVLIHSSDPVAFFWPLDEHNERWEELHQRPDWHWYGKDYAPSSLELIERFLHVVERHPGTAFIGAHVLSYAENLGYVAQALDRYPNLCVDFTERIGELGRQPYSARRFMTRYADRILFGSDYPPSRDVYAPYFRFLETADEYFEYGRNQGRWPIYGIDLPDDVLRKIYHENACRLIPGLHI